MAPAVLSDPPVQNSPKAAPRRIPAIVVVWGMFGLLALLALGLFLWTSRNSRVGFRFQHHEPLPIYGVVPEFSLTERDGRKIDRATLAGGIWIADFIFTRCAGTCPTMSRNMATLQNSIARIPEVWPPAVLVSFTVDPDWDSPEALGRYAERYDARNKQWIFLTGPWERIQDLARNGFHLGVQPGSDSADEPIVHSQSFVLVDRQGRIRGYYDGTETESLRRILVDVARLARER